MELIELVHTALVTAINGKLTANQEDYYRRACRFYSKTFHTPLHQVIDEIPPYEVLLAFFEEQMDRMDTDDDEVVQEMLDRLYTIEDPEYSRAKEDDIQDFIKHVENKNEQKLKKKAQQETKAEVKEGPTKNSLPEQAASIPENLPKGGMINLSYLEKLDDEKPGFED